MNRVFPSLLDAVLCPPCSVITVRTIDRPVGNRLKLDHRGISSGQSSTLLGDETAGRPSDVELALILDKTQIYWICGNHDTDNAEDYDNLFESNPKGRNVQERRVVAVGGILIAGIGGVFCEKIWDGNAAPMVDSLRDFMKTIGPSNKWRDGIPLRHRSTVFPSTVRWLAGMRVDILVTHEAPDLHRFGKSAFTKLAQDLQVKKAFQGITIRTSTILTAFGTACRCAR